MIAVRQDELLALIDAVRAEIGADASMDGFVHYHWSSEPGVYHVHSVYRIGNDMGQGGVRMTDGEPYPDCDACWAWVRDNCRHTYSRVKFDGGARSVVCDSCNLIVTRLAPEVSSELDSARG